MFERRFIVAENRIHLSSKGDDLAEVVDTFFGLPADGPRVATTPIHIEIDRSANPPQRPSEQPRFQFPPLAGFPTQDGFWLVDDAGWITVNPVEGTIRGAVCTHATESMLFDFVTLGLWFAITECLRVRRRYHLHAAAVIAPSGETLLLPGPRKAGKSTLTLALLECGYTALSDDTVFIARRADGAVELLGHPRRFHLRADLIQHRPELLPSLRAPAPFEPQDKRVLAHEERFPGQFAERAEAPARILFPRITGEATSRVVPWNARHTLLELLEHSCLVFVHPELTSPHLDALRVLVDGKGGAELRCGRDLLTDPTRAADLIGEDTAPWAGHRLASS